MALLEMIRAYVDAARQQADREEGVVGMEYAVVAAVVIVAVAVALRNGAPSIAAIVNDALSAVQGAIA